MPGSPEVVQTLTPSASVSAGESASELERSEDGHRRQPAISKVAWLAPSDLGRAEWLSTGRRLGAIGRCSQWWIGDWIRYGNSRWGEKYVEAGRVTGYDVASLRNMAWVAAQFDPSLRSDKLSWSHHVLLAPLAAAEQRAWIERAVDQRLSVADLRIELRSSRHRDRGTRAVDDESEGQGADVCPHCGHTLSDPDG